MIDPLHYLPTVRWSTTIYDVVLVSAATTLLPANYRITIIPEDVNEDGAITAEKEVGFLIKDYIGHVFKITAINVGGDFTKVIVSDDFRTGYGPQTGRTAVVYKSVGMGRSPYIAPIEHARLDKSALDYSRTLELDILYKRLYNETFVGDITKWLSNIFDDNVEFGVAIGQDNSIIGNRSATFGQGLTTNSFFETVLGTYSLDAASQNTTTWINTDRLFTVGNGSNVNTKSIALELFKSGYLKLYNSLLLGEYSHGAITPINGTLQYKTNALQIVDTNIWYKFLTGLPETVDGTTTNLATIAGHTHLLGDHKHYRLYQPDNTNPFVYTDNLGKLHIDGDIIQSGSTYETHAEQIYTKDDTIILRDGAISGLSIGQYTGFTAKLYDGVNDGQLVFDSAGWARVGDIGNLQPLTTRIETPTNGYYSYWEDINKRLNFKQIPASDVVNIPEGSISAITVQLALNELDSEKQPNISLTTTGTSGAASFNGTILNIPNYATSTDTNYYPNSMSFGTGTGNLSLSGPGVSLSTSIDGRYSLLGHTHAYDNYSYWLAYINGSNSITVGSTSYINFVSSTNMSISRSGNDIVFSATGGSMVYPSGSGIPIVSGGSSWGTTITNNSTNWNTAYTNIGKTSIIGSSSYYQLASYYFSVSGSEIIPNVTNTLSSAITLPISSSAVTAALSNYQPILVSGTNIKTINGNSLLGSGNITISASVNWGSIGGTLSSQTDLNNALANKAYIYGSGSNDFSTSALIIGTGLYNQTWMIKKEPDNILYWSYLGIQKAYLDTSGNMVANNFILWSDKRKKENIKPINTINKQIEFVEYNMINNPEKRYGVIAQQVEEIAPELVRTNKDGIKSVAYIDLLILKIAELEERIKKLENG